MGAILDDDSAFCTTCGSKVGDDGPAGPWPDPGVGTSSPGGWPGGGPDGGGKVIINMDDDSIMKEHFTRAGDIE